MSMNEKKIARLDDVARLAGVSTATVSRYINAPDVVAEATAERIRQAIERTGYIPNLLAGGLASRRSRLVALLVPDITHSIYNLTIEAMSEALSDDGYVVMLGLTGADDARAPALIEAALARRADGIILTGSVADPRLRARLERDDATVIETWNLPDRLIDAAVGFSHTEVGQAVARFVRQRGYRHPFLLTADSPRAKARRNGFIADWIAATGASPGDAVLASPTRFGMGRTAFAQLRANNPAPDVVICSSDWLAHGLIAEAQSAGLRVPDDLAVVGFGNLPFAAEMQPALTTVRIDGARIGREAVAILRRRATGAARKSEDAARVDVGFEIVVGASA